MSNPYRRNTADGILEEVQLGGRIQLETLAELLKLLAEKTDYPHHIAVEVTVGAVLKTLDNEADALETIARLKNAPSKTPAPDNTRHNSATRFDHYIELSGKHTHSPLFPYEDAPSKPTQGKP